MDDLFDRLESWTARQPEKLLFCFLDDAGQEVERHTYASFMERVHVVASHLRQLPGVERGDRVLLVYPPGLEMICALFACVGAGLVPVPAPAPSAFANAVVLRRIEGMARDCHPVLLLTSRLGAEWVARATSADGAGTRGAGLPPPAAWLASDEFQHAVGSPVRLNASPLFMLQYTSGSTNHPKGVMVSVANVLSNCSLVVDHVQPVCVSWLPQHHDMGLLGYYVYIVLSGGTTYGFAPTSFIQRPALWLEAMTRYRATASSAPNFAFDLCLRPAKVPDAAVLNYDLSSLRFLMAAAEPISPDIFRRFLQRFESCGLRPNSFFVAYGLAENTLAVSNHGRQVVSLDRRSLARGEVRLTERVSQIDEAMHLMSCGRPLGDNKVAIVSPGASGPSGEREVGEIWISGGSKCMGYWNDLPATQHAFEAVLGEHGSAWLRSGDMGFLHDGELYVCGRHKDMIIVRGENHYPQDVETVVERASPHVRPGCVAAFEADIDGRPGVVVIAGIGHRRSRPDGRALVAAILSQLGLDIDCIAFVSARSVPKTSSGKLMRHACRQMWQAGEFALLGEFRRERHDEPGLAADGAALSPLELIRRRYSLRGDENFSLIEAGIDSLDLVTLLHEVREMIAARSSIGVAERVDVQLIQGVSIADLYQLVEQIEHMPQETMARLGSLIESVRAEQRADELAMMRQDVTLPFAAARPLSTAMFPARSVLLTGGTGFLGPFLLRSLLEQTSARVQVLTRGASPAEAVERLRHALATTGPPAELLDRFDARVSAVCGDLEAPSLGLDAAAWRALADSVDAIYHNGAAVNYLFSYVAMRDANVAGTSELLRLAFEGRPKQFNHVSTTFIFGWATKDTLYETDLNAAMELLDFGYSQSKWVAEQRVFDAASKGLATRIFRPALITPSTEGGGENFDITIRLLCFMIKHGIGVQALNQVSFLPADVTANNIVAIAEQAGTLGGSFHVTRDDYANMRDVTDIITQLTGRRFEHFALPDFVPEVVRRCTRDDLLYPLLDFLVGSIGNISSMEFKRYDSAEYQRARNASPHGRPDPSMTETVQGMLRFMSRKGIL